MTCVLAAGGLVLVWAASAWLLMRDARGLGLTGAAMGVALMLAALGPYGALLYFFWLRTWLTSIGGPRFRPPSAGDDLRRTPTIPDE